MKIPCLSFLFAAANISGAVGAGAGLRTVLGPDVALSDGMDPHMGNLIRFERFLVTGEEMKAAVAKAAGVPDAECKDPITFCATVVRAKGEVTEKLPEPRNILRKPICKPEIDAAILHLMGAEESTELKGKRFATWQDFDTVIIAAYSGQAPKTPPAMLPDPNLIRAEQFLVTEEEFKKFAAALPEKGSKCDVALFKLVWGKVGADQNMEVSYICGIDGVGKLSQGLELEEEEEMKRMAKPGNFTLAFLAISIE